MTAYVEGDFNYKLHEDLVLQSCIKGYDIHTPFIDLFPDGVLVVHKYYASDGPSGPTFDMCKPRFFFRMLYKKFLMPSFGHDAEYQLIRAGLLPSECRDMADQDIRQWCLDRKMWEFRANAIYKGLQLGGGIAASPKSMKKVRQAP